MRILLLARYGQLGASSRVRLYQYVPFLERAGWEVEVEPLFFNEYIDALYERKGRIKLVTLGYLHRMKVLARARSYDLIWIEKEIFPFMPAWAEGYLAKLGVPYIVDYDDALFHRYDSHRSRLVRQLLGTKIDDVMRGAACVVAGNQYLAERACAAGARNVELIPTVVNSDRYFVAEKDVSQRITVGWIGSPATSHYLESIAAALDWVMRVHQVRVVTVGAGFEGVGGLPVEIWSWSEEAEVRSIQNFDIGIMPLPDEPWERGKCGYKLIQYMACGIPVIASPVGVNTEIVNHGVNGFLASTVEEWKTAFVSLLSDTGRRKEMGLNGREMVEQKYCLQIQAPRLELLLRQIANN